MVVVVEEVVADGFDSVAALSSGMAVLPLPWSGWGR